MKFKISKSSDHTSSEPIKPCEKAVEFSREVIAQPYSYSPVPNLPDSWFQIGANHRTERMHDIDNVAVRDLDVVQWEVEINSLDELLALRDETQSELIVGEDYIRIYDEHE